MCLDFISKVDEVSLSSHSWKTVGPAGTVNGIVLIFEVGVRCPSTGSAHRNNSLDRIAN